MKGKNRPHLKFNNRRYSFSQGPGSKRTQHLMGKRLKEKGTIKSYRVVKGKHGYLLYTR